jgi:hypothetical protein
MTLLGSAVGLALMILTLFSLPLSVLAFVHLTGWNWFGAIVSVVLIAAIPLLGQLGYLILAGMGAYYLIDAGFDWKKAAYPATKAFSVAALSEIELERFRANVVGPSFERTCKTEALKTNGFEGKLPQAISNRCECFAINFAAKITRDDLVTYEKTGEYPADVQMRVGTEVRRACLN